MHTHAQTIALIPTQLGWKNVYTNTNGGSDGEQVLWFDLPLETQHLYNIQKTNFVFFFAYIFSPWNKTNNDKNNNYEQKSLILYLIGIKVTSQKWKYSLQKASALNTTSAFSDAHAKGKGNHTQP